MNEIHFRIYQFKKIETNNNMQAMMKAMAGLVVFTIFFAV